MQEQRRMRDQQEEQDVVQGVPAAQVSGGGHVQERVPVRPAVKLVQDPLPTPGTAAAAPSPAPAQQQQQRQQQPAPPATSAPPAAATTPASAATTPSVRGPAAFSATVGGGLQTVTGPRPDATALGGRQTPPAPGRGQQQLRGR